MLCGRKAMGFASAQPILRGVIPAQPDSDFERYWSSQVFSKRQLLKMLLVCVVTFLTRG